MSKITCLFWIETERVLSRNPEVCVLDVIDQSNDIGESYMPNAEYLIESLPLNEWVLFASQSMALYKSNISFSPYPGMNIDIEAVDYVVDSVKGYPRENRVECELTTPYAIEVSTRRD
jgi:hypothetical protein